MTMTFAEPKFVGLFRVISGGQTGADRGGIEAAFELGVETGGHAPKDYRTSRGNDATLAKLGLVQDMSYGYPPRTRLNVRNSDGTVIIGTNMQSPGSVLTHSLCVKNQKHCRQICVSEQYTNAELMEEALALANWIRKKKITVLNVAGNRDQFASYLHQHMTFKLIQAALLDLYSTGELHANGIE